jgi:outer membrane lipoprotein-sorting protein
MTKLPPMFAYGFRAAACGALLVLAGLLGPNAASAQDTATGTVAAAATDAQRLRDEVYAMERAYAGVKDYTATFYKQERVKGTLLPVETILLKFRKPFSVYLRWTAGDFAGREVLFVRGWNDDKVRAHQGSFPDVTVNLQPDAALAMRGNRHPITDLGFGEVIDKVVRGARLSELRPQDNVVYVDHGESTVYGVRARCIESIAPVKKFSPYYAHRAKICIDQKTKMPVRITIWDDEDKLVEDYGFENIRLNVGLTDLDFDPANSNYNF